MKNILKEKMLNNEPAIGTFIWMGGASTVESLGYSGLDFIIIDNEHGPFEVESTQEMIRVADLSQVTPCVRITDISRTNILKQLDIGAEAIIVPDIKTVDEVKDLIRFAKYYPVGERGVAFARKAGYGYAKAATEGLENYFETVNNETLLFPQCETKESAECIEEIVALDGVDGIFVGPYDLSTSLGVPGDFESEIFKETFDKVCKAIKDAGKWLMIFTFSKEEAKQFLNTGANAVVYSSDVNVLVNAFQKNIFDIKNEK